MPSGKVRWFDAKKGYGFITSDDGRDVFLPVSALPAGVSTLRKGAKVEFSEADGRKGPQALDVKVLGPAPSVVRATRPQADDMAAIVEDLIKLLDSAGNGLRRHHYPSANEARKLAAMLRVVADDFDVQD
ncbi:MAG: cold shock domain-containing protein [Bifidobacteriaceae bacterium]|jgi:CspA family cold shock protein|nr:cold shock domain-containing protein [Bifidobacteriaceae bacterium]